MEPPVTFFNPAIAPSGAAFYQGTRFPQFVGNLFAATLRGTHLLRLVVDAQGRRVTRQERLLDGTFGRLRDVVVGPDGYIYICTNNRDGRGSPAAPTIASSASARVPERGSGPSSVVLK